MTILAEVVAALLDACGQCGKRVRLVVKPHPSEAAEPLSRVLRGARGSRLLDCRIAEKCKTGELISVADGVLGIVSTALLEAALCGKPALSLQLGRDVSVYPDRYFANLPGVRPVYDSARCRLAIRELVCGALEPRGDPANWAGGQAASRVVQALLENLSKAEAGTPPAHGNRTGG